MASFDDPKKPDALIVDECLLSREKARLANVKETCSGESFTLNAQVGKNSRFEQPVLVMHSTVLKN